MFVVAFNDEDPGIDSLAQDVSLTAHVSCNLSVNIPRRFWPSPDIVGAALGGLGVEEVAGLEAKVRIALQFRVRSTP